MAGRLRDLMQSASNTAAGNVSGPVDLISMLLRYGGVPVPQNAVGGSQWMAERGLTAPVQPGPWQLAGETLGLSAPIVAAAKAPQIAGALLRAGENMRAPASLNPQAGVVSVRPPAKPTPLPDEYGGLHRPPMSNSGAPLHDLTGGGKVYPDDVYSYNAARYYGAGNPEDDSALFQKIHALKGKPDEMVDIFRAVPKEAFVGGKQPPFNHGDWVTISRKYAVEHGEGALNGEYKIMRARVPAKALFTNGDSPYEFGLDRIAGGIDRTNTLSSLVKK